MSGSAGGHRISTGKIKATVEDYINRVLSKFEGFKSAKTTGSYNLIPRNEKGEIDPKDEKKDGHGDIDLIVFIEGEDKIKMKNALADYLSSLSDDIIVPFKSKEYAGKKLLKPGELVTILYPIVGAPGEYVQIDNIVTVSENETTFKKTFLDIPAATQGLILGLVKVAADEEDNKNPKKIFAKLGIQNTPSPKENQKFEFNLSSGELTLRLVTMENGKEVKKSRLTLWSSTNWEDVIELLSDYNIKDLDPKTSFENLLQQIKSKASVNSKNRIKGVFNSMVSAKSGEVGTQKGDDKEKAKELVAALEGKYSQLTMELIKPFLNEEQKEPKKAIAVFPGAFKPFHKSHFEAIKRAAKAPGVGLVKVFISNKPRQEEGQEEVTQKQALEIWNIYRKHIEDPVEIIQAKEATPVRDAYLEIENNPDNEYVAIYGKGEEGRWKAIEKDRDKYKNARTENVGNIGGVSATSIRTAMYNYKHAQDNETKKQALKQIIDNLPDELSKEDQIAVLKILLNVPNDIS